MDSQSTDDDRTLWVGNVDNRVTEEILWELFLQAGPLESVKIPKDFKTGRQKNFAFVKFQHEISVRYVIDLMDGICLCGTPLSLNFKNKPGSRGDEENGDESTPKRRRMNNEDAQNYIQAQMDWAAARRPHQNMVVPYGMNPAFATQYPFQAMQPPPWMQRPNYHTQGRRFEEEPRFRPRPPWECNGDIRSSQSPHDRRAEQSMRRSYSSPNRMHEEEYRKDSPRDYTQHSRRGGRR